MRIGVAVFAYNRSSHLEQVLQALRKNKDVGKRYFFHDGLQCEEHREEWEAVRRLLLREAEDQMAEIICSDKNCGLAASLTSGIHLVLEENDAVVVLEDDCVPHPDFLSFMEQCFLKYKGNKEIYSVSGYSWPIDLRPVDEYDIYFTGRISSWGWGTWKERWLEYNRDYDILRNIRMDCEKSKRLGEWGNDLEETLIGNIKGTTDSWAVFWALKVIEKGGYCIHPYESLIRNIGCDGTGVHCRDSERFEVKLSGTVKTSFRLPNTVAITEETKKRFTAMYGSYTTCNSNRECRILVYGQGGYFSKLEKEINQRYYIEAFIDRQKRGYYAGKKIIRYTEIGQYQYQFILIMIQNQTERRNVADKLVSECHVPEEKILFGQDLF